MPAAECPKQPAKSGRKRQKPARQRRKACRFADDLADHSGDGTDGGDGDDTSEEETAHDREFIDDQPVAGRRQRLPRVTADEKVVSEDELENLKDTCLEVCSGASKGKRKRAYADEDDLENARSSDEDFLASDSGEEDLRQAEAKVGKAVGSYLKSQGVQLSKKPSALSAESHKELRKGAFERTMALLKGLYGQAVPGAAAVPRVRPTEAERKPAAIFTLRGGPAKPCPTSSAAAAKPCQQGLVLNPVTKEVSYRHRDGRLSPRPGAL